MRRTPSGQGLTTLPAPPDHDDDHRGVVEAARRGEREAWQSIYGRLGGSLTRYAASRGVSDPEDVTQEVMYAAAEKIQRFSGDWDGLRSWLFTIAYRRCADHHRRRSRRPEFLTDRLPEEPDHEAASDGALWAEGEGQEALAALNILEEREREVVRLRVIEERSTAEVAEALGISPGNVRVIQSRALARLRRYLENSGGYLDRRFRKLALPALPALERLRALTRLTGRTSADLTGWRLAEWLTSLRGAPASSAVLGTGAVAAAVVAAGLTAGGLGPAPVPSPPPTDATPSVVTPPPGGAEAPDPGGDEQGGAPPIGAGGRPDTVHQPSSPGLLSTLDPPLHQEADAVVGPSPIAADHLAADAEPVVADIVAEESVGRALAESTQSVEEAADVASRSVVEEVPKSTGDALDDAGGALLEEEPEVLPGG